MTLYRYISKARPSKPAALVPLDHHSPVNSPVSLRTCRTAATSSRLRSTKAWKPKFFPIAQRSQRCYRNRETHVYSPPSLLGLQCFSPTTSPTNRQRGRLHPPAEADFSSLLSSLQVSSPLSVIRLSNPVFQRADSAQHPASPHRFHKANGQ